MQSWAETVLRREMLALQDSLEEEARSLRLQRSFLALNWSVEVVFKVTDEETYIRDRIAMGCYLVWEISYARNASLALQNHLHPLSS